MDSKRNILIAFCLNLGFALIEFVGGGLTGSVAILSDAVHDLGDAAAIGISLFLEHLAGRKADDRHSYGFGRYSVLGAVITTLVLLLGSLLVIGNAISRIFNPQPIHYDGLIMFALFGVVVNLLAAYVTRGQDSLNQRAVNLHMLEDVLGWVLVLLGGLVMRFTNWVWIDPLLSIGVAAFISYHAVRNLSSSLVIFLEMVPSQVSIDQVKTDLMSIPGIEDAHHIHLWSLDGHEHYATLHVVCDPAIFAETKHAVKDALMSIGIDHVTVEMESPDETHFCDKEHIHHVHAPSHGHHHHHH